jgi:hypothetical protein
VAFLALALAKATLAPRLLQNVTKDLARVALVNSGLPRLAFARNAKMKIMPAVATAPMIRREIGDDHICVLTFDRPDSGANIFDAATLDESE